MIIPSMVFALVCTVLLICTVSEHSCNNINPHTNPETAELLSDSFLNELTRRHATRAEVERIFGEPSSITTKDGIDYVSFNLAMYFPALLEKSGRVGFTARFKSNVLISWEETFMSRG
jgi:hypothetical protein